MANLYKRYMKLLDKWPIDETKSKDLGLFIRDQVKIAFKKGEASKIADKKKCLEDIESLERLASNQYAKKYPVNFKYTASGLKPEECTAVLDKDFQEYLSKRKLGFFERLKLSWDNYFSKKPEEK